MDFDCEFHPEFEPERFARLSNAPSQLPAVYAQLRIVTRWLQEVGVSNDDIMLNFYNEAVRIALKSGVVGGYMLACKLYWHIVDTLKRLHGETQTATYFIPTPLPPRTPCAGKEIIEDNEEFTVKLNEWPVDQRLWRVTGSLEEAGIKPHDLVIGYFNSYLQLATETIEPMRVYTLTCQLSWHLAKIIEKLHGAVRVIALTELPTAPSPGKPPANDSPEKPPANDGTAA